MACNDSSDSSQHNPNQNNNQSNHPGAPQPNTGFVPPTPRLPAQPLAAPLPVVPVIRFSESLGQAIVELQASSDAFAYVDALQELELMIATHGEILESASPEERAQLLGYFNVRSPNLAAASDDITRLILALNLRRAQAVLSPFRTALFQHLVPLMETILRGIHENLYIAVPVDQLPPFPIGDMTIDAVKAEAIAGALRSTEATQRAEFEIEHLPFPDQDTLEGRWQARAKMAINLVLNYLLEGTLLREETTTLLTNMVRSGAIPPDYAAILYQTDTPPVTNDLYPCIENRNLSHALLELPQLSFASMGQHYSAETAPALLALHERLTALATANPDLTPNAPSYAHWTHDRLRTEVERLTTLANTHATERARLIAEQERIERERVAAETIVLQQNQDAAALAIGQPAGHFYGHSDEAIDTALRTRLAELDPALAAMRIHHRLIGDALTASSNRRINHFSRAELIRRLGLAQRPQPTAVELRLEQERLAAERIEEARRVREAAGIAEHHAAQVAAADALGLVDAARAAFFERAINGTLLQRELVEAALALASPSAERLPRETDQLNGLSRARLLDRVRTLVQRAARPRVTAQPEAQI